MIGIYQIFKKPGQTFTIGDYYMTAYSITPMIVSSIRNNYLNDANRIENCAKIPFNYKPGVLLTDDQLDIIQKAYNSLDNKQKSSINDAIEFILKYKVIDSSIYTFFTRVKDIEFIPKTYNHFKTLYSACSY